MFLGRIDTQGVCAGQVDDVDAVALVADAALLGADGDAGVVADVLVGAADHVEQGGLAAVGIAEQGHVDDLLAVVVSMILRMVDGDDMDVRNGVHVGFALYGDFDEVGFGAAQRDLVAHDGVLDGVVERGVEHDVDYAPLDEAHLHDALAEGAMAKYLDDHALLAGLQIR